jgi:hypothetical protein
MEGAILVYSLHDTKAAICPHGAPDAVHLFLLILTNT